MDIPSLLQNYGGPGGVVAVAVWLFVTDKKHSSERRAELREDIDREQADNKRVRDDNDRLRGMLKDRDRRIVELEADLRKRERGGE